MLDTVLLSTLQGAILVMIVTGWTMARPLRMLRLAPERRPGAGSPP